MACCVILAAIIGAAVSLKTWLTFGAWRPGKAQEWRLDERREPGQD